MAGLKVRIAPKTADHTEFWGAVAHVEGDVTSQIAYDIEMEGVSPEGADVLVEACAERGWSIQRSDIRDWDGPKWLGSANNWGRTA